MGMRRVRKAVHTEIRPHMEREWRLPENSRWLLDFCGYYNGEEEDPFQALLNEKERSGRADLSEEEAKRLKTSSMFWYYEQCWVKFTLNWECGRCYYGPYLRDGLEDFLKDNGTPMTLKAIMHNRYFHWSGGYSSVEEFKEWYIENYERYRDRSRQEHLSLGKRILNEYRLEFLIYKADWEDTELTPEMEYKFDLVDCVDGLHSYENAIDEEDMCRALGHAALHDLTIEVIPDSSCQDRCDGWTYVLDFKEIRVKALKYLEENIVLDYDKYRYDTVEFLRIWKGKYVYSISSSQYDPEKPHSIIGKPDALIVDGEEVYISNNMIDIMYDDDIEPL